MVASGMVFRIRFRTPGPLGSYGRPGSWFSAVSGRAGRLPGCGVPSMCPKQRWLWSLTVRQRPTVEAADLATLPDGGPGDVLPNLLVPGVGRAGVANNRQTLFSGQQR
jgi:hypothetical protein